jgi:hypothetical protein
MKPERKDLERTAYHEAGHAVAAHLFRRRFRYVTVEPTESSSGHVATWLPENTRREVASWLLFNKFGFRPAGVGDILDVTVPRKVMDAMMAEMIIMAAGDAAEVIHLKEYDRRGTDLYYGGSFADMMNLHDFATSLTLSEYEALALGNWIKERTLGLIAFKWHWKVVQTLAKALLRKRRIGYKEAREIMSSTFAANADRALKDRVRVMNRNFKE